MRTQTTDVYEGLKQAIAEGIFQPAESLTELDLAQQYGVSRNTVKKALLMLERENLVTIEKNKSAKVRAFTPKDVLDYLEVREALEGLVIRQTVPVISAEQIQRMEDYIMKMEQHIAANELLIYSQCNYEFHATLYEACPNHKAVEMIQGLKNQLRKFNFKTILVPGRTVQSMSEHRAILNTIKQGDAELAEILMRRHIANVRTTFQENYTLLF